MNESIVEFKKTDGNPIKFNFQLPNGLPYKPLIIPELKFVRSKKTNEFGLYSYYKNEYLPIIKNIHFTNYMEKIENEHVEIWLMSETHYVVFENLNDKIIQELRNKNLGFYFFNEQKEFIRGFKV